MPEKTTGNPSKSTVSWFPGRQRTLRDDEVPSRFRKPGIKTGYRLPNRGWGYYLVSLFHVNNETVNVWTHLVGCVLMIYHMYSYAALHDVWTDGAHRVIHVFNLCSVLYTLLSAAAHTFHSKSALLHYVFYQGDYAGISLNTYSCGLGAFYICCRNEALFRTLEPVFLPLNSILACMSYLGCSLSNINRKDERDFRTKLFKVASVAFQTGLGCSAFFARYVECFLDQQCSMASLNHHTYFILTLAAAVFFYCSHKPDTLAPGRFDFIGQGHQIFHILALCFTFLQQSAAEVEIRQLKSSFRRTFPTWPMLSASLITVICLQALTTAILSKYFRQQIESKQR